VVIALLLPKKMLTTLNVASQTPSLHHVPSAVETVLSLTARSHQLAQLTRSVCEDLHQAMVRRSAWRDKEPVIHEYSIIVCSCAGHLYRLPRPVLLAAIAVFPVAILFARIFDVNWTKGFILRCYRVSSLATLLMRWLQISPPFGRRRLFLRMEPPALVSLLRLLSVRLRDLPNLSQHALLTFCSGHGLGLGSSTLPAGCEGFFLSS
jgi:hypothetical protein